MSITLESVKRINTLKNSIEATTGETYANLTEGIQALKDGYGQGGGTTFEDALSMFAENEYPSDLLVLSCNIVRPWIFSCMSVSKLYLPNAETIGNNAVCESSYLTTVRLGCVKSLGRFAFSGNAALEKIIIETTNENDLTNLFSNIMKNGVFDETALTNNFGYIYVPNSVIDKYHAANEGWEFNFDNSLIVTIEDNIDLLSEDFPDLVEKYGNS